MPRLQIMHLPAPADEFPFLLVIDQCEDADGLEISESFRDKIGARGVLVFSETVEVV